MHKVHHKFQKCLYIQSILNFVIGEYFAEDVFVNRTFHKTFQRTDMFFFSAVKRGKL